MTIQETPEFKEAVKQLQEKYGRLPEALDGLRWILERNPEVGHIFIPAKGFRMLKIDGWPGVPDAYVYYYVEASKVVVYGIAETECSDDSYAM